MTYQAGPIKRRRRTKAQIETLEGQIYACLMEDWPQSVRHVFYRMTDPRLSEPVEKTERGYSQVQNRITLMRRSGQIPYGWITDATRRGYHVHTYASGADFLQRVAGLYRGDLWRQAGAYVEVWCESRSIAGVIEDDCEELAVSLYPAGGFTSLTLAFQAAEYINAATDNGAKPAHVLYVGDYDPAGVLIDQAVDRELREQLHPDVELHFYRLAITEDQIAAYDLPTKPRKASERRVTHLRATVEAEAMPANLLRSLLRDRIESYLPADALHVTATAEASERDYLRRIAAAMEVRP